MSILLHKADRYLNTLRYLKPVQVIGRIYGTGKRRLGFVQVPEIPSSLVPARLHPRVPFIKHEPWNTAAALWEGRFTFLGKALGLGRPVAWNEAAPMPLLWQFNLHYFHYLHLLSESEQVQLCREWIAAHPPEHTRRQPVAWHPYTTALRIISWCKAGLASPDVEESLYRQAGYLIRTMETYHPGNHLLENARALIMAGQYFSGCGEADLWLRTGLRVFRDETPRQVLDDGGYFELTPMYHALMLEAYLDLVNVLPGSEPARGLMTRAASDMADYLASILHPDGTFPLFNDATHEIAPPPEVLLAYAEALVGRPADKRDAFHDSGIFVCRQPGLHLVIDGGQIGPDYLPAHAHADIFTYEASFGGEPFIVDTGTYEYQPGAARDYDRSTAAHNTVEVEGKSQAECWGSFRVARRYKPREVTFRSYGDGGSRFHGLFDGYAHLVGDDILHFRTMNVESGQVRVKDEVMGFGTRRVTSRIHLHPEVEVTRTEQGVAARRGNVRIEVVSDKHPIAIDETRYSPRFGVALPRPCLVLGGALNLPEQLTYTIHFDPTV